MRDQRLFRGKTIILSFFMLGSFVLAFYVALNYWPTLTPTDLLILLIYLVILVVLESFPITIGRTNITFGFALSFMAFLQYGLVIEMLLVQASLIISSIIVRQTRKANVVVFNSGMLIYMSIAAAAIYTAVGGQVGFTFLNLTSMILPIMSYGATYFVLNHLLIYVFNIFRTAQKKFYFLQAFSWDGLIFFFSLTFGALMYIANNTFGLVGLLIFATLYFMVILIIRLYVNHKQLNLRIKVVNKLVNKFTSELDLRRVIEEIQNALPDLMDYDYENIHIIYDNEPKVINPCNYLGGDGWDSLCGGDRMENCLFRKQVILTVMQKKEPLLISDASKLEGWPELNCPREARSLLSMPMLWQGELIGVITFASRSPNAFTKQDIDILSIFGNRAALALNNAANYKVVEDKSLLDELTGLYNYRACIDILMKTLAEAGKSNDSVGLLMIDIDHFKNINDTYGHQAGNQVLRELAKLFVKFTRINDILCRYGGEEFMIIIPQGTEELAYEVAERIRLKVEEHDFVLTETFDKTVKTVKLTVSIGIATYPVPAEALNDLIRFSDRALYYGAKKKGRNKVAVYRNSNHDD